MHFGRVKRIARGLRFRLTFWNTGVILFLVLLTFVGLRQGLRVLVQNELDTLLREDLDEVALIVERYWPNLSLIKEDLDRKAATHKAHHWYVRIRRAGVPLSEADIIDTIGTPPPLLADEEYPAGPATYRGWRLVQARLNRPVSGLIIRVGCRQTFVEDDVNNLTMILAVAAAVLLVAAPLTGYWLAGRAIRPLADMVQTAARVRPDHLLERIPFRGAGDELDQLAATLNGLFDRIGSHLERQRAFVANAAHELRSPLAALRTSAEVALEHEGRSAEDYRERLADIVEACEGLGTLVNQLLLLAEGEAGLVRAAVPVDLGRLAARTADMFQGVAEVREVRLTLQNAGGVYVLGSATHLRQVLSNLVDNALKFTPAGGSVTVSVRRRPGGLAEVEVSDTGVGIAASDLPHVFERFYRADRARQRETGGGGSGLGLSICQALVAAHRGQILLTSQQGQGTRVTVLLPTCEPDGAANLTEM